MIMERVSRRAIKKRPFVKDEDIQVYAQMEDPQIDLDHLSDDTKIRIENIDELIDLRQRMKIDKHRGKQLEAEY